MAQQHPQGCLVEATQIRRSMSLPEMTAELVPQVVLFAPPHRIAGCGRFRMPVRPLPFPRCGLLDGHAGTARRPAAASQ